MKKKLFVWLFIIVIVICFVLSPLFAFFKSVFVMSIYSASEKKNSILKKEDIDIRIPGGLSTLRKDWYPFVITYNADGFKYFAGEDVGLTILYNFGAFDYLKGYSSLYDETSDYHGSFYGAYAIKDEHGTFGYTSADEINVEEMSKVFKYDMQILVLESIGCYDSSFDFEITNMSKRDDFLAGEWDIIDAKIFTNSPLHTPMEKHQAYIQYGKPEKNVTKKDFKKATVYGRIYSQRIEEKNVTLCFYIIAPSLEAVNRCESEVIENSTKSVD